MVVFSMKSSPPVRTDVPRMVLSPGAGNCWPLTVVRRVRRPKYWAPTLVWLVSPSRSVAV
jgi:hypothetical protein